MASELSIPSHYAEPMLIALAWRPLVSAAVDALGRGACDLAGLHGVRPLSPATEALVRRNLATLGASLVALPEQAWATSVAQWMGTHWELLVDLWTEAGRSELVLAARLYETAAGAELEVYAVYEP